MKKICVTIMISFNVFGLQGFSEEKSEGFDKMKAKTLEHLEKKINSLNEMKTCVNQAIKGPDLKACREKNQDEMHNMVSERKQKHLEKMKERRSELDKKIQDAEKKE